MNIGANGLTATLLRLAGGIALGTLLSTNAFADYTGTAPLIVANGGTGAVTITAHGVLLGQGTSALTAVSPGATSGVPLIAQGSSSDPIYGTALVVGGGTGVTSVAVHQVLVATASNTFTAKTVPDCTDVTGNHLNYTQSTDLFSCGTSGSGGASPTLTSYTSTLPMTMSTTNLETVVSNMGTPAAGVYNLPTAAANLRKCLKDGSTNFATNNATVKATGTIDGVAGATGYVLKQAKQETCFLSDGTNWVIE